MDFLIQLRGEILLHNLNGCGGLLFINPDTPIPRQPVPARRKYGKIKAWNRYLTG